MIAFFALVTMAAVPAQAAEGLQKPGTHGPLNYLQSFGSPGHEIRQILLALTWLSFAVVVIITALVVIAIVRRGRRVEDMSADTASVIGGDDTGALRWIYAGLVVTVVILLIFITWTVSIMAATQSPATRAVATIDVTGHQWWWQVAYKDDNGATLFETANEIRIPVGQPVRFVLRSADVIHSFWVPLLGGKTDMIPGQENVAWLRADTAGIYRGQCVEYCGLQHAHMAFDLFALPPQEFDAWLAQQTKTARNTAAPRAPQARRHP
ncbi:cytochrome c oxidase subunit II [Aquicoccus sp. G2-2]|uniref:cytochrome c oxidase subunit II n=1 Tax=Aquicoccus sp. G2-2 TaxID=3092120 RepID=UPI002ADFDBD3|nr:cytochrome c oxidase subunit II [Aquicoccus sp. G2-2]MEA1115289.1 cytochrome c oxidase subunit II [Aquicoccus sp. G2-2]